jgi:hypothetical protein
LHFFLFLLAPQEKVEKVQKYRVAKEVERQYLTPARVSFYYKGHGSNIAG